MGDTILEAKAQQKVSYHLMRWSCDLMMQEGKAWSQFGLAMTHKRKVVINKLKIQKKIVNVPNLRSPIGNQHPIMGYKDAILNKINDV